MKLTWFGQSTFRIHIGGAVVAVEPDAAIPGLNRHELASGADCRVAFATGAVPMAAQGWKRRPPLRLLDAGEQARAPQIIALDAQTLVLDADGEALLILSRGALPTLGRWAERSILALSGEGLAHRAAESLARHAPRLLALAGSAAEIDKTFTDLRDRVADTGLIALEPHMGVEV